MLKLLSEIKGALSTAVPGILGQKRLGRGAQPLEAPPSPPPTPSSPSHHSPRPRPVCPIRLQHKRSSVWRFDGTPVTNVIQVASDFQLVASRMWVKVSAY